MAIMMMMIMMMKHMKSHLDFMCGCVCIYFLNNAKINVFYCHHFLWFPSLALQPREFLIYFSFSSLSSSSFSQSVLIY